jgi:hypothetical protein
MKNNNTQALLITLVLALSLTVHGQQAPEKPAPGKITKQFIPPPVRLPSEVPVTLIDVQKQMDGSFTILSWMSRQNSKRHLFSM